MLERGFALVRDGGGHPLRSAAAVSPGMSLDIEFSDGCVGATAQSVRNAGEAPARAQASPPHGSRASRKAVQAAAPAREACSGERARPNPPNRKPANCSAIRAG